MTKLVLSFLPPKTVAGTYDFDANVVAFRNGGTSTILLKNGSWSLLPGESLHVGSQTDVNVLQAFSLDVDFDTSLGAVNLFQVLTIKPLC